MKTKIVYATALGNSKTIAEKIGVKLRIEVQNVSEFSVSNAIDTLIIVGGIYGGKSKKDLKEFVNSLNPADVKRVAVITSSGAGERRTTPAEIVGLLRNKNINVLGELNIRGRAFIFPTGHPNEEDFKNAKEWAEKIIMS
ncbi:MAG: uncharacterized protein K0R69_1467 [Clostridia bacterium]|jgi:flavodoxin|nr:uncharacterized protein [Clostridia bacterium]